MLPVDSKWPASNLIEAFTAEEDPAARHRLKRQIEDMSRKIDQVHSLLMRTPREEPTR